MKKEIKEKLDSLATRDIYSVMLFALYQMKHVPEYATLSELIYILSKEDFFKLLEYFGGTTITIPTTEELREVVNALLLYQFVNIEGVEFNKAFRILEKPYQTKRIKDTYFKLVDVLNQFDFVRVGEDA